MFNEEIARLLSRLRICKNVSKTETK